MSLPSSSMGSSPLPARPVSDTSSRSAARSTARRPARRDRSDPALLGSGAPAPNPSPPEPAALRNWATRSVTALRIVCGSIPCSLLYACCTIRRRSVSPMAPRIESVITSAYRIDPSRDVARGTAHRLDQRGLGAEEALLVGVEDRHECHLGKIEAFTEKVDADEHVELAEAKVPHDLDPFDRVDVRVQVADLEALSRGGSRRGPRPSSW